MHVHDIYITDMRTYNTHTKHRTPHTHNTHIYIQTTHDTIRCKTLRPAQF